MHELTQLIKDDMRPALGVTEPGAIAYAVSKAKSYVPGELEQVTLLLNSGMYKNAFTCGIPGTSEVGNYYAAALGAVAGSKEGSGMSGRYWKGRGRCCRRNDQSGNDISFHEQYYQPHFH